MKNLISALLSVSLLPCYTQAIHADKKAIFSVVYDRMLIGNYAVQGIKMKFSNAYDFTNILSADKDIDIAFSSNDGLSNVTINIYLFTRYDLLKTEKIIVDMQFEFTDNAISQLSNTVSNEQGAHIQANIINNLEVCADVNLPFGIITSDKEPHNLLFAPHFFDISLNMECDLSYIAIT